MFLSRTSSLQNIFSESEFPSLPKTTAKKWTIQIKSPPGKKLKEEKPGNKVRWSVLCGLPSWNFLCSQVTLDSLVTKLESSDPAITNKMEEIKLQPCLLMLMILGHAKADFFSVKECGNTFNFFYEMFNSLPPNFNYLIKLTNINKFISEYKIKSFITTEGERWTWWFCGPLTCIVF